MLASLAAYASASSSDSSASLCVTPMAAMSPRPRTERRPAPLDAASLQASVPTGFGFSTSTTAAEERAPLLLQPSGTNYETVQRTDADGTRRFALIRGDAQETREINVPTYVEDAEQDGQAPPQYETVVDAVEPQTTYAPTAVEIALPSRLATLVLGTARAQKVAIAKAQRQVRRIDDAHAGWAAIGIDTRTLMAQGKPLPPHFFSPPRCDPAQIEKVIKLEFGL